MGITNEEKEAYFLEAAQGLQGNNKGSLILVGGIRSLPVAEQIIEQGWADYISMSRPFIREPGLIKRWNPETCGRLLAFPITSVSVRPWPAKGSIVWWRKRKNKRAQKGVEVKTCRYLVRSKG